MNHCKILNIEPAGYSEEARAILSGLGELDEREVGNRDELIKILPAYHVLITRLAYHIDRDVIEAGLNLKVIVTPTTGLDHIDLGCAAERGIRVISLKGETQFLESITATAELTWGLILALIRQMPSALDDVRAGKWRRDLFRGIELKEKCLGILGYGRLGKIVARYALAFQMKVFACDIAAQQPIDGIKMVDLPTLLAQSDIITLHLPLDETTVNMVSSEFFSRMKSGSYFINTSRGGLVDEQPLLEALNAGKIAGAAVDVISGETGFDYHDVKSPMIEYAKKNSNLIITPHVGGATWDSMWKTEIFVARKLHDHLQ